MLSHPFYLKQVTGLSIFSILSKCKKNNRKFQFFMYTCIRLKNNN